MEHPSVAARVDDLSCQALVELVTDYLESALSQEDSRRFEEHIDQCVGCQTYLAQVRQTIHLCAMLQEEPIPAAARQELLQRFQTWKRR